MTQAREGIPEGGFVSRESREGCNEDLSAGRQGSAADMVMGDPENEDGKATSEYEEGANAGRTDWES